MWDFLVVMSLVGVVAVYILVSGYFSKRKQSTKDEDE